MTWGTSTAFAPGTGAYPRRLIEADLPIAAISRSAREGRSVHHGHITAIHIWWARKPLSSCRAAILGAILLDPADPLCPPAFRARVALALRGLYGDALPLTDDLALRHGLSRFLAECSSWQAAREPRLMDVARDLLHAAHQAVAGPDAPPVLVADPFAGGGSIPLEALRLGCAAHASDLNPVAALIGHVTLEAVQRHSDRLIAAVEEGGAQLVRRARDLLAPFYPPDPDGAVPIAYLWFRHVTCEGPGCGAQVVLGSKFHLLRDGERSLGLRLSGWDGIRPTFSVDKGPLSWFQQGTVRRGAATCLRCGHTMPVERVRAQLLPRQGGVADARLLAVATVRADGRGFRAATARDLDIVAQAQAELHRQLDAHRGELSLLPEEPLPPVGTLGFRVQRYGMLRWRDLFTPRQLLTLAALTAEVRQVETDGPGDLAASVRACLALCVDRVCDYLNSGCSWNPSGGALPHLFTRQALPIIWDFGEANPLGGSAGDLQAAVNHVLHGLRNAQVGGGAGSVQQASASRYPLPTDYTPVLVTDPPYYDAIPYADLSDFFYVWLRRMLRADYPALFAGELAPRDEECIVNRVAGKDRVYFRRVMTAALSEARRVTRPDGIGVVIFAHKSTEGWEDLLAALIEAGWIITASWPIDTENAARLRARGSAVLASSIHLVCRPRERPDGALIDDTVGEWRDVLDELPRRIGERMARLHREGIVGADAIFACLGPALEVYSRWARVERASGEAVPLREFLVEVWAAISRQALSVIFHDAEAAGLEPDARMTAMWLWTLLGPGEGGDDEEEGEGAAEKDEDDEPDGKRPAGYALEFDAARKIAMGLGVNLSQSESVVEVRGGPAAGGGGGGGGRVGGGGGAGGGAGGPAAARPFRWGEWRQGVAAGSVRRAAPFAARGDGAGSAAPGDDPLRRRSGRRAEDVAGGRGRRQGPPAVAVGAVALRALPAGLGREALGRGRAGAEEGAQSMTGSCATMAVADVMVGMQDHGANLMNKDVRWQS